MLKIRHSVARRMIILDLGREGGEINLRKSSKRIFRAVRKMSKGYTLVEVYREGAGLAGRNGRHMGALLGLCYSCGRIWRVIKISVNEARDPGLGILHRTRWKREVPETEVDSVKVGAVMVGEEIKENAEWI